MLGNITVKEYLHFKECVHFYNKDKNMFSSLGIHYHKSAVITMANWNHISIKTKLDPL